jgi:hypothetical protein
VEREEQDKSDYGGQERTCILIFNLDVMSKKRKKGENKDIRPKSFRGFQDTVSWLKKSVYFIARGRKTKFQGKESIKWQSIGTGFLAGDSRMVTAAHVLNNPQSKEDITKHKDGDIYYFIKHDENNETHWCIATDLKINETIFTIPQIDFAVFYLDELFYGDKNKTYLDREEDIIPISLKKYPLGTEIGVLGYPLVKLEFENNDINKPLLGNILLRADKGVINCRYNTSKEQVFYEFTLNFNPGNSGGPIFHTVNGYAISIVQGFKDIIIEPKEIKLEKKFKHYKEDYFINSLSTRYSVGISTTSMAESLKEHGLEIKE